MLEFALVIGFAAFRVARLVALDAILDGPRHWFFRRFPPDDHYAKYHRLANTWQIADQRQRRISLVGKLVACMWCSSVWIAAAIVYGVTRFEAVPLPVLTWAAACSVAGICATLTS